MKPAIRLASDDATRPITRRFNFNKAQLAAVKCPAGKDRVFVWDTKTPALCYMVTPAGARSFYFYGRVRGGRPVRIKLGGDELSIEQARKRCLDEMVRASSGVDPAIARQQDKIEQARQVEEVRQAVTLGNLWTRYLNDHLLPECTSATLRTDVSLWEVWLADWTGRVAKDISEADVRLKHSLIARGKEHKIGNAKSARKIGGKRTANKTVKLLRRMYRWARLPSVIVPGAVDFYEEHARERYLDQHEMRRFMTAINAEANQSMKDAILLGLIVGAARATSARCAGMTSTSRAANGRSPPPATRRNSRLHSPFPPLPSRS